MGIEDNKALVKRWVEKANKGDKSALDCLASNYVYHMLAAIPPMDVNRELFEQYFDNPIPLSDVSLTIGDIVAEGDKVVILEIATGIHTGKMMNVEPTGKTLTDTRFGIFRIENGKIAEGWGLNNLLGMFQQMGVTPPSG